MRASAAGMESSASCGGSADTARRVRSPDRDEHGSRRNFAIGNAGPAAAAIGLAGARIAAKDPVGVGQGRPRSSAVAATVCHIGMGCSHQTKVCGAHVIEARRGCHAQYPAGTLDLAAFDELDFERGEVHGWHRSDAAEAQSAPICGIKRLETAIDVVQSIGPEKKDEVQYD